MNSDAEKTVQRMEETLLADCLKPKMPTRTTRMGLSAMTKFTKSMGVFSLSVK